MKWKNSFLAFAVAVAGVGSISMPMDAEAKRLGGGRASGMQRQMPSKQPDASPSPSPNQSAKPGQSNAAATGTPGQPAAQAGKRSWMGPIAGLAAGLGIAALMSHLGMGEAFSNFLMMALLGMAAVFAIGWLMRRFKGGAQTQGPQLAGAGAPYSSSPAQPQQQQPIRRQADVQPTSPQASFTPGASSSAGMGASAPSAATLSQAPADFDVDGFQRVAKMIFIRLQAANDSGNVDDLRKFTTPELFASLRLDLQDRGDAQNQTDVMQLEAEIVDTAREDGQWIVSVRFHGLIREEVSAGAQPFNELWHIVKPEDGSREWAIAGITPLEA
jgi:predicted lipid-binding transport protein (Tim44 family)